MAKPNPINHRPKFWFLFLILVICFNGAWTTNEFGYKPSLGARGSTEKGYFDSGLDRIDTRLGKEIWVGDPKCGTTVQAAITAIGTTNPTILRVPTGSWAITADLTIPVNIILKPERGAILTNAGATTKNLTINGGFEAGLYQVLSFTGTGKVVFGAGAVKEVYSEWWGAKGDNSTACSAAINAAVASLPTRGGIVRFQEGRYLCATKITGAANVTFAGKGAASTFLYYSYEQQGGDPAVTAANGVSFFNFVDGAANIRFADLSLNYTGTFDTGTSYSGKIAGIKLAEAHNVWIERCEITGFNYSGIHLRNIASSIASSNINIEKNILHGNRVGGIQYSYANGVRILNNEVYENGLSTDPGTGYGMAASYYDATAHISSNILIAGNKVYHNKSVGIDLHTGMDVVIRDNTLYANPTNGIGDQRLHITAFAATGDIQIINNNIKTMRDRGLAAGYYVSGITVGIPTAFQNDRTSILIQGNRISDVNVTGGAQVCYPIHGNSAGSYTDADWNISDNYINGEKAHTAIKLAGYGSVPPQRIRNRVTLKGNQVKFHSLTGEPISIYDVTEVIADGNQISVVACASALQAPFVCAPISGEGYPRVRVINNILGIPYNWYETNALGLPIYPNVIYQSQGNTFYFAWDEKWRTATAYSAGAVVYYATYVYRTAAGGTSGATPPTHTNGEVSDGTVTWRYLGKGLGAPFPQMDCILNTGGSWSWLKRSASDVPPISGYWDQGSVIDNTAAATGAPSGWRCTAAGYGIKEAWTTAHAYVVGNWVSNAGKIYYCVIGGTAGATAPVHASGEASDDACTWAFVATGSAAVFKAMANLP